jgi:hypothetical protein
VKDWVTVLGVRARADEAHPEGRRKPSPPTGDGYGEVFIAPTARSRC